MNKVSLLLLVAVLGWLSATAVRAEDGVIAQVKTVDGDAHVERGGQVVAALPGVWLRSSDVLVTGGNGALGVTFVDNSMMSLGPDSRLSLDVFQFDSTTNDGVFESSLARGTLAVKSGKIVQQTPEAMKIRTPVAVLGVRGTEFVVRAEQ